jgi:c-di-GMP-binding flagellar brake protein YcgR
MLTMEACMTEERMATPTGRIEKDFFLKFMFDEKLPVNLYKDRIVHTLILIDPFKEQLKFRADPPLTALKTRDMIRLLFNYYGQLFYFSSEIKSINQDIVNCHIPESIYKDLRRSFLRVEPPSGVKIQFSLKDLLNKPFAGKVVDISASGLLLACPISDLYSSLTLDAELAVTIIALERTITINAKIKRRFKDRLTMCFGCAFHEMPPEDMRFLFDCIYGKSLTVEQTAILLCGHS